ncbi:MAG: hypothetical protein QXV60_00275 [Nitrososphaerota archaeon]
MDQKLYNFLTTVASISTKDNYNHITYEPKNYWKVNNYKSFWSGYCDLVQSYKEPFTKLCLGEKINDVIPLITTLSLRFYSDSDENIEPYDEDVLQWLCYVYQTVILENFKITTSTRMELVVVILESSSHWYETDKNGKRITNLEVRIQFPYSHIDYKVQNTVIKSRAIHLLKEHNVLSKFHRKPIGEWEEIIQTLDNSIVMYGSSEFSTKPKLELTHIWPYISKDILDNEEQVKDILLQDIFIPQYHAHVQQQLVPIDIFEKIKDYNHWLPMFLSLHYWPVELHSQQVTSVTNIELKEPEYSFGHRNREVSDNYVELSEKLVSMLNPKRFLEENYWLEIGRSLYFCHKGSNSGLESWIRYTQSALNNVPNPPVFLSYNDNSLTATCAKLYYSFTNSNITIKTLAWYAREDSYERYTSWHRNWCMPSIEAALSCLHTDVATALYYIYWLDFLYCPCGKGKWYQFRNHRWYEVNKEIEIRQVISSDFVKRFENIRSTLVNQFYQSNEHYEEEVILEKLSILIAKLKLVTFKNNIVKEAREKFNNNNFISLLDSNTNLVGVSNGVLEILKDKVIFRSSKPEDYISMSTNIPYNYYSWNDPLVKECMKWFSQVFTDKDLLHHFLKFASSCLKGRNSDKVFPIWTGEGDNSKSMIVKLFEHTFSSYCVKLPVSLLNERNIRSSNPTPQLARTKFTKIAFLDEPEDDIPIHKSSIKRYTGGDSFFARFLHDNGNDIQATFKLVLICNRIPSIPNADKAIKNRIKIFPFLSTWVDDAPEDEDEQYKQRKFRKDPFFENRIPTLAPAFLWILTEYYPFYYKEGLSDPPIVTESTKTYWDDNDIYTHFINDTVEKVRTDSGLYDKTARVTLSELYNSFKSWFVSSFPGSKIPEKPVFTTAISSRWGRPINNSWYGVRIK